MCVPVYVFLYLLGHVEKEGYIGTIIEYEI